MESKHKIDTLASRKVGNVGLILCECEIFFFFFMGDVKLRELNTRSREYFTVIVPLMVERYHTVHVA